MLNVSIRSNGRRHHAAGGSGRVANHSRLLLVVLRRSGRGGNMLHNGRVQPLLLLLSSVVDLLLLLHRPGRVRCRSGHAGANRRSGAGWHSSSCCWRLLRGLIHGSRLRLRRPGRIRTAAASNACSRSAHIGADLRRGVGVGHGACHLELVLLRWQDGEASKTGGCRGGGGGGTYSFPAVSLSPSPESGLDHQRFFFH